VSARPGVTTWYLEMTDAAQLRPARPVAGFVAERIDPPDPELSARMYDAVGGPWQWTDRLGWDVARWRMHLRRAKVETWLGRLDGEPAGYAELWREGDEVEIASFGLLPGFPGRGLGGALLAAVTGDAWERGARRVWLHTCSLDSPAALPSYERRGFRRYREERS
jgi:ribosomal protein S18 acetylase RimI-like enzyme